MAWEVSRPVEAECPQQELHVPTLSGEVTLITESSLTAEGSDDGSDIWDHCVVCVTEGHQHAKEGHGICPHLYRGLCTGMNGACHLAGGGRGALATVGPALGSDQLQDF